MADTEPEIVFAELVDRSSERNSGATESEIVYADLVERKSEGIGLNRKYFRPEDLRRLSHAEFSSRRAIEGLYSCLLYTSPSPRDQSGSRMPSSA